MPQLDQALDDWELRIKQLDARLRPIATRPVDITKPGWLNHLQNQPLPLDEAGIRKSTEALLIEIVDAYPQRSEEIRGAIRQLFVTYRSFAWAATLPAGPINS